MFHLETYEINDHIVTFDDTTHTYTVDQKPVISVTQLIDMFYPKPYKNVDLEILKKAAKRGNQLHDMIEQYERFNKKTYHIEMHGYLALKTQHQFRVKESEKIVLIYHDGIVIAAGRFDMVIESPYIKGLGIADVKRMAHLDETRLILQLNLYKLGYEQTYKTRINYLKCIHIRNRYYNFIDIPINKKPIDKLIQQYLEKHPIDYTHYY